MAWRSVMIVCRFSCALVNLWFLSYSRYNKIRDADSICCQNIKYIYHITSIYITGQEIHLSRRKTIQTRRHTVICYHLLVKCALWHFINICFLTSACIHVVLPLLFIVIFHALTFCKGDCCRYIVILLFVDVATTRKHFFRIS